MSGPISSLASLASLITKGTTPTTLGYAHADSGIPFLRVQNIFGGRVNYDEDTLFIDAVTHNALKRSKIQGGDVLVTIAGTIGRTGVVPFDAPDMNCNQAVAIVRPTEGIDRSYLRYWLESQDARSQMLGSTVTGTISNLSLSQLGELKVPLPPLEAQRRIATILDKADALRAKRREALVQLDRLAQSIFVEMFSKELTDNSRVPLSELVTEFRYGTSNKSGLGGYPALRIPNVAGRTLNLAELKTVEVSGAEFERLRLIDGDILFVRTNGNQDYVGRSAVFRCASVKISGFDANSFIYASYLIRARLRLDVVLPEVLQSYLESEAGRRDMLSHSKTSAGQFNINMEGLGALRIPLLPLHAQKAYAERLHSLNQQRNGCHTQVLELDKLFNSLQSRVFSGEL